MLNGRFMNNNNNNNKIADDNVFPLQIAMSEGRFVTLENETESLAKKFSSKAWAPVIDILLRHRSVEILFGIEMAIHQGIRFRCPKNSVR